MRRRVVVTGLGMISPLGLTVEASWQAALAGRSGVKPITSFDASPFPTRFAASVEGFHPELFMPPKEVRRTDCFLHYAIAAAQEAMQDSGLTVTEASAPRMGVAVGAGVGGIQSLEEGVLILHSQGPRKVSPFFLPGLIINMPAGHLSIQYNLQGPNISVVTACTTGLHNIGQAARIIAYGDADAMLCGGSEMPITPVGMAGFGAMRALSTRNEAPEQASRPFDRDRDGFVLGAGAGMMVLEALEHAEARGAKIYAELAGFGMSSDAYHPTAPHPRGAERAMNSAIMDAKLPKEGIGYINAHATSTPLGDISEVQAIKGCFGDDAYQLAVSSTKSMTGHLMGASGAVAAIFTVLALRDQVLPPTINLDHPDEGCDLHFVPHQAEERRIQAALSNSFGFGGTNGSLLFTKFE